LLNFLNMNDRAKEQADLEQNFDAQKETEEQQVIEETKDKIEKTLPHVKDEYLMKESYTWKTKWRVAFEQNYGIYLKNSDEKSPNLKFDYVGKGMWSEKKYYVKENDTAKIIDVIFPNSHKMKHKDGTEWDVTYGVSKIEVNWNTVRIWKYLKNEDVNISSLDINNSYDFGFKILTDDEDVNENTGTLYSKFEKTVNEEKISENNKEVLKLLKGKGYNIKITEYRVSIEKDWHIFSPTKDAELSFKDSILTVVQKDGTTIEVDYNKKTMKVIKEGNEIENTANTANIQDIKEYGTNWTTFFTSAEVKTWWLKNPEFTNQIANIITLDKKDNNERLTEIKKNIFKWAEFKDLHMYNRIEIKDAILTIDQLISDLKAWITVTIDGKDHKLEYSEEDIRSYIVTLAKESKIYEDMKPFEITNTIDWEKHSFTFW